MTSKDFIHLEKSVAHAGTQLNTFAFKLNQFERNLEKQQQQQSPSFRKSIDNVDGGAVVATTNNSDDGGEELDDEFVMELLESMAEVKNDYQNLRKDIQEVQQLQKEMTNTIRFQMTSMHQTFKMLKKRIEVNRAARNK